MYKKGRKTKKGKERKKEGGKGKELFICHPTSAAFFPYLDKKKAENESNTSSGHRSLEVTNVGKKCVS